MNAHDKYIKDLDNLIQRGVDLQRGLYNEFKDEFKKDFKEMTGEQLALLKDKSFKDKYDSWYNESYMLIKQLMPDRLEDFIILYKQPKRKAITNLTYTISDYLQGIEIKDYYDNVVVSRANAVTKFRQQFLIVNSLEQRFESSLYDICQLVQADLMDSEIDSAKLLLKNGFLRAAGAVCGVVLERHFAAVCKLHNLKSKKKNPCINDYNQLLKDENVIDTPTWRHIQLLGDIRNLCDHKKDVEPTKSQIEDLINGTDKVIKTVF